MTTPLHVLPVGDLIVHDEDGDGCVCGPATQCVQRDGEPDVWLVVHNSLDGREQTEPITFATAPIPRMCAWCTRPAVTKTAVPQLDQDWPWCGYCDRTTGWRCS